MQNITPINKVVAPSTKSHVLKVKDCIIATSRQREVSFCAKTN